MLCVCFCALIIVGCGKPTPESVVTIENDSVNNRTQYTADGDEEDVVVDAPAWWIMTPDDEQAEFSFANVFKTKNRQPITLEIETLKGDPKAFSLSYKDKPSLFSKPFEEADNNKQSSDDAAVVLICNPRKEGIGSIKVTARNAFNRVVAQYVQNIIITSCDVSDIKDFRLRPFAFEADEPKSVSQSISEFIPGSLKGVDLESSISPEVEALSVTLVEEELTVKYSRNGEYGEYILTLKSSDNNAAKVKEALHFDDNFEFRFAVPINQPQTMITFRQAFERLLGSNIYDSNSDDLRKLIKQKIVAAPSEMSKEIEKEIDEKWFTPKTPEEFLKLFKDNKDLNDLKEENQTELSEISDKSEELDILKEKYESDMKSCQDEILKQNYVKVLAVIKKYKDKCDTAKTEIQELDKKIDAYVKSRTAFADRLEKRLNSEDRARESVQEHALVKFFEDEFGAKSLNEFLEKLSSYMTISEELKADSDSFDSLIKQLEKMISDNSSNDGIIVPPVAPETPTPPEVTPPNPGNDHQRQSPSKYPPWVNWVLDHGFEIVATGMLIGALLGGLIGAWIGGAIGFVIVFVAIIVALVGGGSGSNPPQKTEQINNTSSENTGDDDHSKDKQTQPSEVKPYNPGEQEGEKAKMAVEPGNSDYRRDPYWNPERMFYYKVTVESNKEKLVEGSKHDAYIVNDNAELAKAQFYKDFTSENILKVGGIGFKEEPLKPFFEFSKNDGSNLLKDYGFFDEKFYVTWENVDDPKNPDYKITPKTRNAVVIKHEITDDYEIVKPDENKGFKDRLFLKNKKDGKYLFYFTYQLNDGQYETGVVDFEELFGKGDISMHVNRFCNEKFTVKLFNDSTERLILTFNETPSEHSDKVYHFTKKKEESLPGGIQRKVNPEFIYIPTPPTK